MRFYGNIKMERWIIVQLAIITSLSIANGIFISVISIQHITTYAGRLVVDLGITHNRTDAGFYAGPIASSFMFGRALGSFYWGNYIDSHGRKKGVMISIISISISSLILGFCKNYYLLLFLRFVCGFFAPIPAIGKTIVSEICVKENAAKGMATLVSGWYIGQIIGNFVGGQFSHPEELGIVSSGIFVEFPYLLPNLICAGISILTAIISALFLKETLTIPEVSNSSNSLDFSRTMSEPTYKDVIRSPFVPTILVLYSLASFNSNAFSDVFPIWCWADRDNGGLEFNPQEIGNSLAMSFLLIVVIQQRVYGMLVNKYGCTRVFSIGIYVLLPTILIFPEQTLVSFNESLLKVSLVVSVLFWNLFSYVNFTTINVMVNDCVGPNKRAKLNSVAQCVGSLFRALGPYISGTVYSTTARGGLGYPLDYHTIFYLIALDLAAQLYMSKDLPEWDKNEKEDTLELESLEDKEIVSV